jgi:hypothetical protein
MLQSIVPCTGWAHPWGPKACVTQAIIQEFEAHLVTQYGWRWAKVHRAPLRLDQAQPLVGAYVYLQKT